MSYIRTKDKIYKVKTENEFTYDTTTGENIFKSDVIKECDNIEDLCDDFVVYGAVWTDKGLIYVAKVNDEGEFELI